MMMGEGEGANCLVDLPTLAWEGVVSSMQRTYDFGLEFSSIKTMYSGLCVVYIFTKLAIKPANLPCLVRPK